MSDYALVLYHSASQGKSSYLNVKQQLLFPDGFYRSMEKIRQLEDFFFVVVESWVFLIILF